MIRDTLLVIDDSPLDLAILREIFKQLFHVECFEESRPALSYIHRNPQRICAVVLDLCLGRRGAGFLVLQQLQVAQETSDLPVILITSDAQEAYVLNAVKKGAADFLVKPVEPLAVQERVCAVVRRTWPSGTTILDTPASLSSDEAPSPQPQQADSLPEADRWERLLELFFQSRPHSPLPQYRLLGQITTVLAKGYQKAHPNCGLSQEDAHLIGRASVFCDIGLLGIPDSIIEQGPDQGGAGQELYFQHTALGHALFTTGPGSTQPLFRYAAEIAYWHHKNYDGSGYPAQPAPTPFPISAQLVRTAIRCMGYMDYFHGYPDWLDRMLRALAGDVGKFISMDLYSAAQAAREDLVNCLPADRLRSHSL